MSDEEGRQAKQEFSVGRAAVQTNHQASFARARLLMAASSTENIARQVAVEAEQQLQQQAAVERRNLATDQVLSLLDEAADALFDCRFLGLRSKRALACTCSRLRPVIFAMLRGPRLVVQESDASWSNAQFVATVLVPNVPSQALCVAGETCQPEMRLAHLQTLLRLKVGTMGWPAAVFFGAAIAKSNGVLRLSNELTCKNIKPLREQKDLSCLEVARLSRADRFAMLGALMLNEHPQSSRAAWLEALPRDRTKEEEEEEERQLRAAAEEANAKAKAKADSMKKKETRLGSTRSQTRAASSLQGTSFEEVDPEAIYNLRVVWQNGTEIFFKMRPHTPFQKLMHAFCNQQGVTMGVVRFLFDGVRINETQTLHQLEMEDGDVIDAMIVQRHYDP
tara:strand:- start:961 stop:2139 length:1179 start_codon:yes stop_codon:yes gene_type:complete